MITFKADRSLQRQTHKNHVGRSKAAVLLYQRCTAALLQSVSHGDEYSAPMRASRDGLYKQLSSYPTAARGWRHHQVFEQRNLFPYGSGGRVNSRFTMPATMQIALPGNQHRANVGVGDDASVAPGSGPAG